MNEDEQKEKIITGIQKVIMDLEKEEGNILSTSMLDAFTFLSANTIFSTSERGHEKETLEIFISNLRFSLAWIMEVENDEEKQ